MRLARIVNRNPQSETAASASPCHTPPATAVAESGCNPFLHARSSRRKRRHEIHRQLHLWDMCFVATNSLITQILGEYLAASNWFRALPPQRFQVLLTLFPKCFSPFPHGTFSLSGTGQYLALEGNYHPFSASFPKSATLLRRTVRV